MTETTNTGPADRWWHLEPHGLVYAYNAETSDQWEIGLSHGLVHYGYSAKAKDRIGFAGVNWFLENARPA